MCALRLPTVEAFCDIKVNETKAMCIDLSYTKYICCFQKDEDRLDGFVVCAVTFFVNASKYSAHNCMTFFC